MPFITEELAHQMGFLKDGESIMYAAYPVTFAAEDMDAVCADVEQKFELVTAGRSLRLSHNIAPGKKIAYYIKAANEAAAAFLTKELAGVQSLLNASEVTIGMEDYKAEDGAGAPSLLCNAGAIFLPLTGLIDVAAEKAKLEKQKGELLGWIKGSEAKLNNAGFVAKAPAKVVEDARAQLADLKEKLARVESALAALK